MAPACARAAAGPKRNRVDLPRSWRAHGRVPGNDEGPVFRSRGLDQCLYVSPFSDMGVRQDRGPRIAARQALLTVARRDRVE